jgi:ParB family transcriptional regulator, chromosome partitioning protein
MARKNLLAGLTDEKLPAGNLGESVTPADLARHLTAPFPNFTGGRAIGAVSRSIEQIKSQAVVELDTALIDPSPIADRLPITAEALQDLIATIRDNGQQVPILVRPHPEHSGRYQIAYGRRRLRACIELGRRVRAMVRSLSDQELVVAQGQENNARADLAFIERALFAASLEEGGYARDTIMAALAIDKTGLSRLISTATKIPRDLIEAIGPAPKAGRDRWTELATRLEASGALDKARAAASPYGFAEKPTDERFALIFAATNSTRPATGSRASAIKATDGKAIATFKEDASGITLSMAKRHVGNFGAYLAKALPQLYEAYTREAQAPMTPGEAPPQN